MVKREDCFTCRFFTPDCVCSKIGFSPAITPIKCFYFEPKQIKGVTNCGRCIDFDEETGKCEGKFKPDIRIGGTCGVLRAGQVDIKWSRFDDYSPKRNILRWIK